MPGQSISAHADSATVARLRQTATREGRSPSQLTAASLRLYLSLPASVRAGLQEIEALGTDEDHHNLMRAIARTVAAAQYDVARRRAADAMRIADQAALAGDSDILAEAVRATTGGQ